MASIADPRTEDSLKEEYKTEHGKYPTSTEHFFGMINHFLEYNRLKAWHTFVDEVLPDYFPFGNLQGFLQSIIDYTYDAMAFKAYEKGCENGKKIREGLQGVFSLAESRIRQEVDTAKGYIKNKLIKPVKDKVDNELMPKIEKAQQKLQTLEYDVEEAVSDVKRLRGNIQGFDAKIKAFNDKLRSFDSKLKKAERLINDLDARVSELERKTKTQRVGLKLPPILRGE